MRVPFEPAEPKTLNRTDTQGSRAKRLDPKEVA
jgi:hypothetical protein